MKKLYEKDEVWFAVGCIAVYVLVFGNADNLSEAIGIPKLLTVAAGLILSLIFLAFIRKNELWEHLGLCPFKGDFRTFLWFIPLIIISSVNFWNGLTVNHSLLLAVLAVLSMCFVGFLEEVIFRGFLFKGLYRDNVKVAIIVSSLSFGVGHIVNLLMGEPLLDTLLQLMYASAIGFCYTVIFHLGGSIIPCIISHAFINSSSVFALEATDTLSVIIAIVQTLLGIGYGCWLLRHGKSRDT